MIDSGTEKTSSTPLLLIERGRVLPFDELPDNCIALDGYCQGPAIDAERRRFSFDHHDGCIRLVTRATCQQVLDALLLGLEPTYFTVYINDVDGDTALAVWLLRNPERAGEAFVRELVESVGGVDAHGPAYPPLRSELALNFFEAAMKPEEDLREAGTYGTADLSDLLETCLSRIDSLLAGVPGSVAPTASAYNVTHRGRSFVMATSTEAAFERLYSDGHKRAIVYQALPDGSYKYTIGKLSDLVAEFPVGPASKEGTILNALRRREDGWGGGSTIGGSPRNADGSSSRLSPDEVFQIVEATVAAWKARR
jgi:hypothetical protein